MKYLFIASAILLFNLPKAQAQSKEVLTAINQCESIQVNLEGLTYEEALEQTKEPLRQLNETADYWRKMASTLSNVSEKSYALVVEMVCETRSLRIQRQAAEILLERTRKLLEKAKIENSK